MNALLQRLLRRKATPSPRRSRAPKPKTFGQRFKAVAADTDTYVLGGWALMSLGAGLVGGTVFGFAIGLGAMLVTAGVSFFWFGIWLSPPRPRSRGGDS